METSLLLGIFLSLIFSSFFASMEAAFHNANKLQIELESKLGSYSARILTFFTKYPSWFNGTTLLGRTIALVCLGTFATLQIIPLLNTYLPPGLIYGVLLILIQILLSTLLALFSEVFLRKRISIINPNKFITTLAIPFGLCFAALFPAMVPIVAIAKFLMSRILKTTGEVSQFPGRTDLQEFLRRTETKSDQEDVAMNKKILRNALEFKTVKIRECMIPRTEITAVEINDSIAELRNVFVKTGHSKVIIYKESIDEIIGYCHSSSLFKIPERIEDILTPIIIVAESTLANDLMLRFINERKSLAVVVDEFGGTSGIVSMEDVIEEIFGEIEDEHDEDDQLLIEQKLYENNYLISARLEIDYLNEKYNWSLPTGEYETLGGLILAFAEDFPKQGQSFHVPPFKFVIQTTGQNRIKTVLVEVEK